MNTPRAVLLFLTLFVPLVANGQDDWQDRLAEATKDMPSLEEMRDSSIVDAYTREIVSNVVGDTDDERAQNVVQFAMLRLRYLSACSLLYDREQAMDEGWVAEHRADVMRRHVTLFATATVQALDPSVTADSLVATMMDQTTAADGPLLDEWLDSPEGRSSEGYRKVSAACSEALRNAMRLEQ